MTSPVQKTEKRRRAARRRKRPKPSSYHDLDQAPNDVQAKVGKLLEDGATVENTVATLKESGIALITERTVENYYRRQMENMDRLKRALKDPASAQARLAEAVLMTGLLGLREKAQASNMQNAIKVQTERESHSVTSTIAKLKIKKMNAETEMLRVKLQHEQEKINQLKLAMDRLQESVQSSGGARLQPEAIQRIQEIYGLLADSKPCVEEHASA
jgi:glutamate-1-semialdehyde aminotransferase